MTDMVKEGKANIPRNHKLNELIEKSGSLLYLLQRFDKRKGLSKANGDYIYNLFVSMKYKHFKVSALEFYHLSYSAAVPVKTRISFALLTNVLFSRLKQNCFFWHIVTLVNLKQGEILKMSVKCWSQLGQHKDRHVLQASLWYRE